jgi:multisubunit Na+/H+ antiporter MnhF subunit
MVVLLLICSIGLLVIGFLLLVTKIRIIKIDSNRDRIIVGVASMFVGAIVSLSCYSVLFTENPYLLLDKIFGLMG